MKLLSTLALVSGLLAVGSVQAAVSVQDTATYNGHTYYLLTTDTWTSSETFAHSLGGNLVTVNDAAENAWLTSVAFSGFGSQNSLWIGLARTPLDSGSDFAWASGQAVTYTNWSGGEPNNSSDVPGWFENYVHTYTNGTWNDLADTSSYSGLKYGVVEVAAVPEPESYAMMLAGLGMMGFVARRKSRV